MSESTLKGFTKEEKDKMLHLFKKALVENDSELFFEVIYAANSVWWVDATDQSEIIAMARKGGKAGGE